MPDDDRLDRLPDGDGDAEHEPDAEDGEIPASVAFMEMMRQAAAKSKPQPSIWADPDVPDARTSKPEPRTTAPKSRAPKPAPPVSAPEETVTPEASAAPDAPADAVGEGSLPPTPSPDTPPAPAAPPIDPMEEQRVRRVTRRKTRRRRRTVGVLGGILRSVMVVAAAAGLMATIFTWWTPSGFINTAVREELSLAIATSAVTMEPTGLPTPNWLRRIGIVSGHRGPEGDPGAVCDDGLTEAEINFNVAQLVVRNLRGRGYTVDLLDEFDPRLDNYQAAALVSIHANTCQDFGELVSGFLVAAAAARVTARGNDDFLVNCISQHYGTASGLERREGVTVDMTDYHTFREIHGFTPAAIIELGFLLADRQTLTEQPDVLARGITDGILCFLEPGLVPTEPPAAAEPAV